MNITYDPAKNLSNLAKHGEPLGNAALLDWDLMLSTVDARRDYGEVRHVGYAPFEQRLYCVVYTVRGQETHIISLRKTNEREKSTYERDFK